MTPEKLLELVKMTGVDGDPAAQLSIKKINIEQLPQVDTNQIWF